MTPGTGAPSEVLDASVVLAYLYREPGHVRVREAVLRGAMISSVNLAEVHSTLEFDGIPSTEVVRRLRASGLQVQEFNDADAIATGRLRPLTSSLGLSLADRACLALALRVGGSVLTTDRDLARADVGVEVATIR